jgi:hypothetical protein
MVARASEPPYETWEDLTANLPDDPIVSFDVTPWGEIALPEDSDKEEEGFKGGTGGKCG